MLFPPTNTFCVLLRKFASPSRSPPVCLYVRLSACMSACLLVYLSVCLLFVLRCSVRKRPTEQRIPDASIANVLRILWLSVGGDLSNSVLTIPGRWTSSSDCSVE